MVDPNLTRCRCHRRPLAAARGSLAAHLDRYCGAYKLWCALLPYKSTAQPHALIAPTAEAAEDLVVLDDRVRMLPPFI